jgi:hypothetical protein
MSNLTNSEVIERILHALFSKIRRRTSETHAVVILDTVLKELEPTYDFFKNIKIQNTCYSEGINAVSVNPSINYVEPDNFYRAIEDLIKKTVRYLERNADFFFIKEFQEAINNIDDLVLKEKDISLGQMQFEYILERKQIHNEIEYSKVVEKVIRALTSLLNRIFPEKQAIKTIITSIKRLEEKYDFLKHIEITYKPDSKAFYIIRVLPDINNVQLAVIGEAIQKLVEELIRSIEWKHKESFIEVFKIELGPEYLSQIKRMGVKLDHIDEVLRRQGHELLFKKTLEVLIDLVSNKASKSFAVASIDTIIEKLQDKHKDVLRYIKIDKSRYNDGIDAISIMPEINLMESHKLGKTLRDIVRMTGSCLGDKTALFIEDFKKKLGDEYLTEIENIGVNLHFLELKFL